MSETFFSKEEEQIDASPNKINLLPFLRIIKRKAWLVVFITAIVAAAYSYWDWKRNSTSQYAGSFQLLVEPLTITAKLSEPATLTDSRGMPNEKLLAVDYPTIVRILRSKDLLTKIATEVREDYPGFGVIELAKNLRVERIGTDRMDTSKILAITYREEDPKLVQLVLDTTAREYLDYSLDTRIKEIRTGLEFVRQQLPELNQKVAKNLNQIQQLQEKYRMIKADSKGESVLATLRGIELEKIDIQREIEEQTKIQQNFKSKLNLTVDEAIAISSLRENSNYQNLLSQYKEKERELAVVSATFNSNSPQMISIQEEKQELLSLLNAETRRLVLQEGLSGNPNRFLVNNNENSVLMSLVEQLVETANNLEALKARQKALAGSASSFEEQARQFPEVSRRYHELQQELAIANRTREQLLIQQDKLQVQASQTHTPWTIISQPEVITDSEGNPAPLPTDSDNRILKGLVGGLMIGIVTAILLDRRKNKFFTVEDILDITKPSPILGEIPFNHNLLKARKQKSLVKSWFDVPTQYLPNMRDVDNAHFNFLDAFDRLYANVYLRYREKSLHSLAICSPAKGDGRSTIALYLARQIAARGKKVLLVDANSFNYRLPDKLISATQAGDNLFVLVASQELLEDSLQREKLMRELQIKYDYVIYDTPPLLDSVTASFLSVETDGVLLAAAIDRTDKTLFMKALEQIETFKLPLLGVVVNHIGSDELPTEKLTGLNNTKYFQSKDTKESLDTEADSEASDNHNSLKNKPKTIKPSNNNLR